MNIEVERTQQSSPPRRWMTGIIVGAVVLAVGLILFVASNQTSNAAPTTTLASIAAIPLDAQAPGFVGTLHAALNINRQPTYLRWEAAASEPDRIALDTSRMRFNQDLTQVAAIAFTNPKSGDLRVGTPGDVQSITPDVTGFAWHDSDPSLIAFTRTFDNTSLWISQLAPEFGYRNESVVSVPPGSVLVAYGAWGYAFHSSPDADGNRTTLVLDSSAIEQSQLRGEVVSTIPGEDGGVLVAAQFESTYSTSWSTAVPARDMVSTDLVLLKVVWSDDYTTYAALADGDEPGIDILEIGSPTRRLRLDGAVPFDFDPSGRFLVATVGSGVVIIDTTDGTFNEIGIPASRIGDLRLSG